MMPSGWEKLKISELLDKKIIQLQIDGNHGELYPKSSEFVEAGIPYLSANCIVDGRLDISKAKFLTEEKFKKLRKGISQRDDVLFAHNATVGPTALNTIDGVSVLSTTLTLYRCNKDALNPLYLKSYFSSQLFSSQYTKVMAQSTRNQVPITAQREFEVLLPPLSEQEKIAKILSTWDEAIALAEKYLALISQLTPSLVRDLFKDCEEFAQLKDVSTVISKGTTPTTHGHNYTDSGVNFLRVENITEIGTIDLKDVKYISEETHQFLQRSILKVGDVLFSIAGAIGRTAVVRESSLPANTNQAVAFIRPDLTSVKSDYLRLALHLYAEGGSIEKLQAGNAQKNFNLEQVGNIKIPISSIEKQMEIIKNAEDIYTHIRVLNNYIHALKLQKQGLMQQLLTGKKRVKV